MQIQGTVCWQCCTPMQHTGREVPCRAHTSSANYCPARFCNRLCLSRSARVHPLLCPDSNPASVGLIGFARQSEWMALHALAQCTSRILLAYQRDEAQAEEDWRFLRAMAQLGMEQRAKGGW